MAEIGYAVPTIAALAQIPDTVRVTGYVRLVSAVPAWYTFVAGSTLTPDNVNIIAPASGTGRWVRTKSFVLSSDIPELTEFIEDTIAQALNSDDFQIVYDDVTDSISIELASGYITNAHISSSAAISMSKVSGLVAALDAKASAMHGHDSSSIDGLDEAVQNVVGAMVTSTDLDITYDGTSNTLVINIADGGLTPAKINGLEEFIEEAVGASLQSTTLDITYVETTGMVSIELEADSITDEHISSIEMASVAGLDTALGNKADAVHGHAVTDVTGLGDALEGFAAYTHEHAISGVTGLTEALDGKSDTGHGHAIADVNGLTDALDAKVGAVHEHVAADITDLAALLADKTDVGHAHALADVTGLVDALDDKTDVGHSHGITDVTGLGDVLIDKADAIHGHAISEVTGLSTALADKSDISHGHGISDVGGLATALDNKSEEGHGHAVAEITDFVENVQDIIGTSISSYDFNVEYISGEGTFINVPTAGLPIEKITDLDVALDDKADFVHTHSVADITDLSVGGGSTDKTYTIPFTSVSPGGGRTVEVQMDRAIMMRNLSVDLPCRIRAYTSFAQLNLDVTRPESEDPTGDHGCLFEVIAPHGTYSLTFAPPVFLYQEPGASGSVWFRLDNPDTLNRTFSLVLNTYIW
jgi:hypothetical protein